jgi:hypothetical protein
MSKVLITSSQDTSITTTTLLAPSLAPENSTEAVVVEQRLIKQGQ